MDFVPDKQIRANYEQQTIRVYQAYNRQIARSAIKAGTFVSPPFSLWRTSWIQPSFLWLMYRTGWARRGPDQERILAIDMRREGFEGALKLSQATSSVTSSDDEAEVRIRWQPERDLRFKKLNHRTIQIGLAGKSLDHYIHRWIVKICDITERVRLIEALIKNNDLDKAARLLPHESPYQCIDPTIEAATVRIA